MIRSYGKNDLEAMVKIWYEASVTAHSFVPASFWASQKNAMKETYLPLAENFIFEEHGQPAGFISLVGEKVCALFVAPEMQGRGIGRTLLEYAKTLKGRLCLKVYRENERALHFYEKCGFVAAGEEIDEYTGCMQVLMEWERI
ncbi:N-acetyltransferase [Methanosarcina sp. MSH10X1]|uniref:N-acetyltransferase n=1 Tax=Methanosarcina sp. MSH10X1 TaxID=2507075 RepID=UPI000FFB2EA2|nr:N-acetyltransferase [Methanosarcina sp. MSH10X1]RXA20841.1 N-acetyltransferase [Methanosarcina sp. MSH10X1]